MDSGIFNVDNHVMCNIFSFTSSFPVWMSFIPFTCLITAVRICSTTLTKSGEGVLGIRFKGAMRPNNVAKSMFP